MLFCGKKTHLSPASKPSQLQAGASLSSQLLVAPRDLPPTPTPRWRPPGLLWSTDVQVGHTPTSLQEFSFLTWHRGDKVAWVSKYSVA